jgi:hypothetical protein
MRPASYSRTRETRTPATPAADPWSVPVTCVSCLTELPASEIGWHDCPEGRP